MKKQTTKKKQTETIQDGAVKNEFQDVSKNEYHIVAELNDKSFEIDCNDIAKAIEALNPGVLRTSLTLKITNSKGKTLDRFLYLNKAKRLLTDKVTQTVFVKNLFF